MNERVYKKYIVKIKRGKCEKCKKIENDKQKDAQLLPVDFVSYHDTGAKKREFETTRKFKYVSMRGQSRRNSAHEHVLVSSSYSYDEFHFTFSNFLIIYFIRDMTNKSTRRFSHVAPHYLWRPPATAIARSAGAPTFLLATPVMASLIVDQT